MDLYSLLIQPFADFGFMRRALVATLALALGGAPLGCLLVLRRMSLVGEAMAHALLPGAAVGYLIAGLSLTAMGIGSFVAALLVALLAGAVSRATRQREDASFTAFYLVALALGVLLLSLRGGGADLLHVLFGSVLAIDDAALALIAAVCSLTLIGLALAWRPLVMDSVDAGFLRSVSAAGPWVHGLLLVLVVANLVSAFQTLGTLMAVGQMMLPAIAARFWAASLVGMVCVALAIAVLAGAAGLLLSFHAELPSGPSIVLVSGLAYLLSVLLGRVDGVLPHLLRRDRHPVAVEGA